MKRPIDLALVAFLVASLVVGCGPGSGSSYRAHYVGADARRTKSCVEEVARSGAEGEEYMSCPGVWLSPYSCDETDEDEQADFCADADDESDSDVARYVLVTLGLIALIVFIALNPDALVPGPSGA